MKDSGVLITHARVGELAVQAHTLDHCVVQELLLDGTDPTLNRRCTESDRDPETHLFGGEVVHSIQLHLGMRERG